MLPIIALLGVLKAGRSWVPLDPSHPETRIRYILGDSQARCILTTTRARARARMEATAPAGCPVLTLDGLEAPRVPANPGLPLAPDTIACLLYPAGSTGQPKGVVLRHQTVLHDSLRHTNALQIGVDDRLTLLRSHSVVGGLRVIFSGLLNGAAIYPGDLRADGLAGRAPWLQQEGITIYASVASVFRLFARSLTGAERFSQLRLLRLGGEPAYARDVALFHQHWAGDCLCGNRLGTTETGTICLYLVHPETAVPGRLVPAGYATEDMDVLLLDAQSQAVDPEEVGEIVVRSRDLSLGYWRQPELTHAAFRPDPAGEGLRRYHTGDLGRFRPDGSLEHLGRKDLQVKIHGYRVEIPEVEAEKHFRQALQANPDLWQSHNFLGMIYDRQQHFDAAIAEYQAAIALQPQLGLLCNNVGMSYFAKGEYEHAVMALRQALTHEPSHKKISNNLGMALGRLGRYQEAFEAFKKGGDEAKAYNNFGTIYAREGQYQEAVAAFEKALELHPTYYVKASDNLKVAQQALSAQAPLASPSSHLDRSPPPSTSTLSQPLSSPRSSNGSPRPSTPTPALSRRVSDAERPQPTEARVRASESVSPAEPMDAHDLPYTVQVHAFLTQEKAQQMIAYYAQQGLPAFSSPGRRPQEAQWWQVFIGRFDTRAEAEAFGQTLKEKERLPAFMVVRMGKPKP